MLKESVSKSFKKRKKEKKEKKKKKTLFVNPLSLFPILKREVFGVITFCSYVL
jgi:hypothetical protein